MKAKVGEEAAKDRVGRNDRLRVEAMKRGKSLVDKKWRENKKEPRTERAGITGRVEAIDGGVEMAGGRGGGGYEQMGMEKTKRVQGEQLFRVPFGGTFTTFQNGRSVVSFLPLVAFVALGVFAFLTLLAFLTFWAFFAFASHISVGGARALALPCVRAFAFTGCRGRSLIRVCPHKRPGGSTKGRNRAVGIPGGGSARVGRRNRRSGGRSLWCRSFRSLTSCRGRLMELRWSRRVKGKALWQGGDMWSSRSWGSLGPAGKRLLCKESMGGMREPRNA